MNFNLVLPAFNVEGQLRASCGALYSKAGSLFGQLEQIIVVSNGSTDKTASIARHLSKEFEKMTVIEVASKGRGRCLRRAWLGCSSDVLCYMDVDLSTDLAHLPELVQSVASVEYDLAVGSRLLRPEWTERGQKREILSRGYNRLVRHTFGTHFSDAQCGFKAISRRAAQALLPLVEDNHWFFDTELLVIAEAAGCRIHDFPVRWKDHAESSTVKIIPTIGHMLAGVARLKRRLRHGLAEEARARWQTACAASPTPATMPAVTSTP